MAQFEQTIKDLERVKGYLDRTIKESEQQEAFSWLGMGLGYYKQYYDLNNKLKRTPSLTKDQRIVDSQTFHQHLTQSEIQQIIYFFDELDHEKEPEEKKRKPVKEDSTVPAELESLVAQYQQAQADKIEEDTTHTVADAVKRARKTWAERNRIETIIKNRNERQKEAAEDFFVEKVNPKAGSRQAILADIRSASRQAAIVQAANLGIGIDDPVINKAIEDLTILGLYGGVDYTNFRDLEAISKLAFIRNGVIDTSAVNDVNNVVQAWEHTKEIEPYSEKVDQLDRQISLADEKAEIELERSEQKFKKDLKSNDLNYDEALINANKQQEKILTGLLKAIPNPRQPEVPPTPLQLHEKELETIIRKVDKTILINPEGLGVRTIAVIQTTKSDNQNISQEALRLYSLGLTPKKLDTLLEDKKSPLSQYFQTKEGHSVYQQVHSQLRRIHASKLGQDIIGGVKPTGFTGFYNNLPPAAQTATKLILDPVGTTRTWVNRRIGESIGRKLLKNTGSSLSQKLGNFLLKDGLSGGIKSFANAAAEKLALEAAKRIGVTVVGESLVATVALALGISTAGASLLIGAVLLIGTEAIKAFYSKIQSLAESIYGEKIKARDFLLPLAALGGAAVAAGATAFGGLVFITRTAQVAIVSAFGIILAAVITIGLYLGFAYMVAPMLSTLVQLDSVEKVNYTSPSVDVEPATPGCPSEWPVKGNFKITQGPGGKYSHYNAAYSQAIDIATPIGTPIHSTSDGVVSFSGVMAAYLNTKVVIIDSKLPNGTAFQVVYAHLTFIKVGKGQSVKVGDLIGTTGTAGTGAHLHYEYKKIKYNQCPAGRMQLAENCDSKSIPGAGKKCVPDAPGNFLFTGSGNKN